MRIHVSYELQLVLKCKIPFVDARMKPLIYTFPPRARNNIPHSGTEIDASTALLEWEMVQPLHRIAKASPPYPMQRFRMLNTNFVGCLFHSRSPQNTSNLHDCKLLQNYSKWTFPCLLPTQRKNAPPTALHHSLLFSGHVELLMSMHSMFLYTHLHCFYSTAKRFQYNVGSCTLVPKVKAKDRNQNVL